MPLDNGKIHYVVIGNTLEGAFYDYKYIQQITNGNKENHFMTLELPGSVWLTANNTFKTVTVHLWGGLAQPFEVKVLILLFCWTGCQILLSLLHITAKSVRQNFKSSTIQKYALTMQTNQQAN